MRKLLFPVIGLACAAQVNAMTVPISDLPSNLQNCFQTNNCLSPYGSVLSTNLETTGAAAFQYIQITDSGVEWNWLMRYDLLTPPGTIGGTAWLSANGSYDVVTSNNPSFTLYYDNSIFGNTPVTLTMTNADLAVGTASFTADYIDWQTPETGTLQIDPWPAAVIESSYDFQFNLLYMNYTNGIFAFNADEARGLLFSENILQWTPGGSTEYTYSSESLYVQSVPLPASTLLFVSGLAGGSLSVRRRKTANHA